MIYLLRNGGITMAVKLRLKRMGAKKRPFYRIVAADSRSPRDGRFIEVVGTYSPIDNPAVVKVDEELIMKWLGVGAIPTDTVRDILSKQGIMKKFHESKSTKAPKAVKAPKAAKTTKEVKAPAKKTTTKKPAAKKTTKKEAK